MVSVDQAYMVGHMKNADGSINNKNVVLSAACEAAELFRCMMSVIRNWRTGRDLTTPWSCILEVWNVRKSMISVRQYTE